MKNYGYLLSYFKRKKVCALFALMLFSSFITLCPPFITRILLDYGIARLSIKTVLLSGICLLFVYIISFFANYLISQSLIRTSNYFVADIKNDLISKVLKLPMEFFDKQQTGYILERVKETDSLNVFFSPVFLKFLTSIFSCVGAWIFILSIRWELSLILIIFLPVLYYFTNYSSIQIKKVSKTLLESNAQTSGKIQENIGGISTIKEMNLEKQRSNEMAKQIRNVADQSIKRNKKMNLASEGIQGFTNIFSVLLIICSGLFIINGKMSMGDYWAVSQYATVIFAPIQILASISVMVQPGTAALSRIGTILRLKTENEIEGKRKIEKVTKVSFTDVSFGYTNHNVIQDFNMVIYKNEKIALLGKNGSGKTTIAKLLMGFYKNYKGSIKINNIELKEISLSDLREKIGIVAQNIVLFSGTLIDNLMYAAPQLTENEITSILQKAGLDMSEFENGLKTIISENGKNLSGGQRQKIAFARMIIKNPDVVIFDEATSNLDVDTQELVRESVNILFADKICIIITHDSHMAKIANSIVRLSE